MAGKNATLAIRIVSDASKASQGFEVAESRVGGFQRNLDRASVAAAGALAVVGKLGQEAFDSASRLQQAGGAVESVFGAQAAAVDKLAEGAADRLGLATAAYSELASVLGSQLKNVGFAGAGLVKQQDELIQKGADLAATFGGTTSDAVEALSSLLRGERDPIERYGVTINEAGIKAKIAALGLDDSTDAAKRAAAIQATLALVTEQTAGATGAAAREYDTAASATQRASANWEDAKAKLGEVLLPVVSEAATQFTALTGTLTEHQGAVTVVATAVTGLAVATLAINAAMRVYAAGQALATAAVWLFNTALLANPITWVVLAIAALVAMVAVAYTKFEWFRDIIQDVWEWLKKAWDFVSGGWVDDAVGAVFGGAPLAATVTHAYPSGGGGGAVAGVYGAAGTSPVPGPVFGASMTALGGGRSSSAQGSDDDRPPVVINITGALDPVAVGRQVDRVMRKYGRAVGGVPTSSRGGQV